MGYSQIQKKPKVLIPTVKQGYTSLLAKSITACGAEASFFEFASDEFKLSEVVHALKTGKIDVDVIHLHWAHYYCRSNNKSTNFIKKKLRSVRLTLDNAIQLLKLKRLGCRLIWTIHNSMSHDSKFVIAEYAFRHFLSRLCDDIILMSNYSLVEFTSAYRREKRTHIIPHGHFIGSVPNSVSRDEARARLNIHSSSKVFLNFGLMKAYKGIDDLLAVFEKITEPNTVLLLAGSCPNQELEDLIKQSAIRDNRIIAHVNFISDDDIQVYMNACDYVVMPFKKILNSGSMILALSFSRPVIVPERGGISEIIRDGINGFTYAYNSQLLESMRRAIEADKNEWLEQSHRALGSAQELDWQNIAKMHLAVYGGV